MTATDRVQKKVPKTFKSHGPLNEIKKKWVEILDKEKTVNHNEKRKIEDKHENSTDKGVKKKHNDKNEKFQSPEDLTIIINNDNNVKNNNTQFKATNYKEHKTYKRLKSYIDDNIGDSKRTIDKLTDALVTIATRPVVVNINHNKEKVRRSKKNSRKRPNKNLRKLLRDQQKLIKENPLDTRKE